MHGIDFILIVLLSAMLIGAVKLMKNGRSCCGSGSSCSCGCSSCSQCSGCQQKGYNNP